MGFRFRKSFKAGPVRFTMSKSGISSSVGVKGFRVTRTAKGKTRTTASIPGTGISYVKESGGSKQSSRRSSPQSNESASAPSPRKSNKKTPLIGISLIILVLIFNMFSGSSDRKSTDTSLNSALPVVTSDSQALTVDQLHLLLKRSLDTAMPGNYSLDVDKENSQVLITVWDTGCTPAVLNKALTDSSYLRDWNTLIEKATGLCQSIQDSLNSHGHSEMSAVVSVVNVNDLSQIFATIERGSVIYDIVAETPAGESISDFTSHTSSSVSSVASSLLPLTPLDAPESGVSRALSEAASGEEGKYEAEASPEPTTEPTPEPTAAPTHTYILNASTGKFHRPGCRAVKKMKDSNKVELEETYQYMLDHGYDPCDICNPY